MSVPGLPIGSTVLVVDDERVVRRVVYRMLTEDGYRVFEAGHADEAMEVLRLAHPYVHLVVLDVVMPVVNGVKLGRRMREQWPSIRLLYMSAYPAEVLAAHGLTDPADRLLAKPFTREELLVGVGRALERGTLRSTRAGGPRR